MKPDKYQEIALRTWYAKDDPRHNDKMPALLGLVGEAGEIAELVKKANYKYEIPVSRDSMLEELGDFWWYLRVVAYLHNINILEETNAFPRNPEMSLNHTALMLNISSGELAELYMFAYEQWFVISIFERCIGYILTILAQFNCTLDELTEMNYAKLQGGRHGWEENQDYS